MAVQHSVKQKYVQLNILHLKQTPFVFYIGSMGCQSCDTSKMSAG